ncbi:MAG: hypothetical protein DRI26_04695 [Chloroflexi bacterium]|nr:MAG: hypothetical protein DRI26_04695 [Chloroflexota bacterium]
MKRVAVVADSIACLTPEQIERYGVVVVPANFLYEGKLYRDGVDVSPSEAYQMLERSPNSFYAAPASPHEFLEAFREAGRRAQSILCLTISRKVSTFYNVAQVAKERFQAESPGVAIEVLDSQTLGAGEALIALAAAEIASNGAGLEEVVQLTTELRDRVGLAAYLDTLRHAYRTGRIPRIAAQVGSLFHVRPLFSVSEGAIHFRGIVRTREQAMTRLLEMVRASVGHRPIRAAVMHAAAPEQAEKFRDQVLSEFDCREIWITEFSPLMGYSSGPGTLGIAFYPEES